MKTYSKLLSLVIIIAGVVISCSKSDPAPTQAQQLVGNWQIVTQITTNCTDPANNEPLATCTASCSTLAVTATALTITTPVAGSSPTVQNFTYTVSGQTITTTPASLGTIVFSVSATTLTIDSVEPPSGVDANCKTSMTFKRI